MLQRQTSKDALEDTPSSKAYGLQWSCVSGSGSWVLLTCCPSSPCAVPQQLHAHSDQLYQRSRWQGCLGKATEKPCPDHSAITFSYGSFTQQRMLDRLSRPSLVSAKQSGVYDRSFHVLPQGNHEMLSEANCLASSSSCVSFNSY